MSEKKVLVADDEEGIREVMEEFLTGEGYEVSLAENGKKALEMFEKDDYGLVFTDIRMPEMDGITALKRMKELKPATKIIIVSGLPDEDAYERAMTVSEGTVEGFIPKPFKPADLRKALDAVKEGKALPSFGLTERQLKALDEVGLAGAENTSQAFSQIVKREVKTAMEKVDIFSLKQAIEIKYSQETEKTGKEMSACVLFNIEGKIGGRILTLFPWESGLNIVDLLEKREVGSTKTFDEKAKTAIKIAANVLAASYLNAAGKHLELPAYASFLNLSFDSEVKVLEGVAREMSEQPEHIITIGTELLVADTNIKGIILLLPDTDSLKVLFSKAGAFNQ